MGWQIMNRELNGVSFHGWDAIKYYNENKERYINVNSCHYGSVLVETKRIVVGFEFTKKLFFRGKYAVQWKPILHWKYGEYYFTWLCFYFRIEKIYRDVFSKIIQDHLAEFNSTNKDKENEKNK